ncbi:MAG: hypothetical protein DRR08_25385 [Candidatus Parabeggiatoa sp. nov. 2]|nr:MAG: hypothetical protein B6247_12485 [Beggiatoa sp. 4572_84]RKZ55038.1 MAG: hypothetical protein DRR08_25385 [Gammaproteobacteria bacterium]
MVKKIISFTNQEKNIAQQIKRLKEEAGSHSLSIYTIAEKLPQLNITVDACFLSNPYATELFFQYFTEELIDTGKIKGVLEYYPSQNKTIAGVLSKHLNVSPKNIFVGNGATEIIQAVIHNFTAEKIVVNIPTFSPYYEFVKDGIEVIYNKLDSTDNFVLNVDHYIQLVKKEKPDTIVLINPNNHDGEYIKSNAWVLKDNVEIEVAIEELQVNDIVVVNTGEVIPIDGIITQGIAMIDQHALTGESQPAEKVVGEQVFASTVIITGKISIKVEKAGNDTIFSKVLQILNHSINSKTHLQSLGEKWADQAALPFLGLSALTLGLLGSYSTLVVLSSTFGYRIRILAPLGTLNHLNLAYQKGILVKEGRALENLTQVDTFLFDKTGTLTMEQPEVGRIISCGDYDENDILIYAAAAERKVAHPLAKAILKKAEEFKLILPDIEDSKYQMGYGIMVSFNNKVIRVGSSRFMSMEGIVLPEKIKKAMAHSHLQGYSIIMVAVNQNLVGAIELQSVVRPEVKQLIAGLRQRGIKHIAIVSGDQKQPTQQLAKQLGMDSYYSEVLPQDKAKIVEQLQKEGKSVCFVGDGINDVIAMKKADVSISLSGASSIATDIAQVIFMDGTLSHLTWLFDISTNLETNLRNSLIITMIPAAMGVSGAFLINMKVLSVILLKNGFFMFGIGNAMLPLNKLDKSPESKL